MGILDQLSSATGDKNSNKRLVEQCLKTPVLLHTVAEGLRSGVPAAQVDCARIFDGVCGARPEQLGGFINDLLDATRSKRKVVAKLGFSMLARVVPYAPAEVYAQRDYLLEVARRGDALGLTAAAALAGLCAKSPNYRGKLISHTLRLLQLPAVQDKQLVKWATTLGPAVAGSSEAIKRLDRALEPRRAALDEAANKKLDRLLAKLERGAR